ncbi:hypothetical protein B0H34DRAFT_794615 [Crassisporium funariophilum]|nr:hypothetical protein B0H34DRAFT_794615 [Crassisporium funariophilum]
MNATKKRKNDSNDSEDSGKRLKLTSAPGPSVTVTSTDVDPRTVESLNTTEPKGLPKNKGKGKEKAANVSSPDASTRSERGKDQKGRRITKLVPPRPFPTVPTSVSDSGPRSSHKEGKNFICLTRKTPLGSYMRRCKDLIIKDGYKTLHLSAMGAAIPHLLQLVCALPPILPFPRDEVYTEVTTGTVEVQDEVVPDDDDEDITYQTRGKSTLRVVFKIGDGEFEGDKAGSRKYAGGKGGGQASRRPLPGGGNIGRKGKGKVAGAPSDAIIYEEPEQEYMDML